MEYWTNHSGEMDVILKVMFVCPKQTNSGMIENNNILKQPGGVVQICRKFTNHAGTYFDSQKVEGNVLSLPGIAKV